MATGRLTGMRVPQGPRPELVEGKGPLVGIGLHQPLHLTDPCLGRLDDVGGGGHRLAEDQGNRVLEYVLYQHLVEIHLLTLTCFILHLRIAIVNHHIFLFSEQIKIMQSHYQNFHTVYLYKMLYM